MSFEGIDNIIPPKTSEMPQERKVDEFPAQKNWAKEGEVKIEKNREEGDKRYLSKYIKALDEIKNLENFE